MMSDARERLCEALWRADDSEAVDGISQEAFNQFLANNRELIAEAAGLITPEDAENAISWNVDCINCAKELDVSYDGWVRGHKAGCRETANEIAEAIHAKADTVKDTEWDYRVGLRHAADIARSFAEESSED